MLSEPFVHRYTTRTPALIDLVDPYCVIASIFVDASIISSLSPGPSCPNTRTQSWASETFQWFGTSDVIDPMTAGFVVCPPNEIFHGRMMVCADSDQSPLHLSYSTYVYLLRTPGAKSICVTNNSSNIEIMFPILNCNMKGVT